MSVHFQLNHLRNDLASFTATASSAVTRLLVAENLDPFTESQVRGEMVARRS